MNTAIKSRGLPPLPAVEAQGDLIAEGERLFRGTMLDYPEHSKVRVTPGVIIYTYEVPDPVDPRPLRLHLTGEGFLVYGELYVVTYTLHGKSRRYNFTHLKTGFRATSVGTVGETSAKGAVALNLHRLNRTSPEYVQDAIAKVLESRRPHTEFIRDRPVHLEE